MSTVPLQGIRSREGTLRGQWLLRGTLISIWALINIPVVALTLGDNPTVLAWLKAFEIVYCQFVVIYYLVLVKNRLVTWYHLDRDPRVPRPSRVVRKFFRGLLAWTAPAGLALLISWVIRVLLSMGY